MKKIDNAMRERALARWEGEGGSLGPDAAPLTPGARKAA